MKPRLLLFAIAVLLGPLAWAQINLPQLPPVVVPLPQLPRIRDGGALDGDALFSSVRDRARTLLRRYPDRVERDPRGAAAVRSVIVAMAPEPAALQRAVTAGFQLLTDTTLQPWGERLVALLAPRDLSTRRALLQLRSADPAGSYDFDHLFVESATSVEAAAEAVVPVARATASEPAVLIGMVDSGVDAHHPVFARRAPRLLGCEGRDLPSDHGTAVASLLVGDATPVFRGAAPGAGLVAVDVYCGGTEPGGRVRDIAAALSQLTQNAVRVINLSFVGPPNVVLERVIRRVQGGGIVIVAAAGNDGPNAAPLYPAAYPGVVAVTAVDARNNVLLEACRGDHVTFAAPGADMTAAAAGGRYAAVRGTSYAAPLVAGLLARQLAGASTTTAASAVQSLAASANDRGRRGRDRSYGLGVVAMDLRTPPRDLTGKAAVN